MELLIQNVCKQYKKGSVWALKDVSIRLTPGVYGLLGPNGAGKSTLMNILTDNLQYESGTITYDGKKIKSMGKEYRKRIGYMPQQQGLYEEFTAKRFLWYMAALKGLNHNDAKEQINQYVNLVNLSSKMNLKLKGFSGGMKQRVLIAQALLGDPEILIFDEPTAGLDPKERIHIRNFISELGNNRIVLLASHVVSDIESIAKEIILLKEGQVIKQDTSMNLLKMIQGKVYEVTADEIGTKQLKNEYKVSNIYRDGEQYIVRIVTEETIEDYEMREVVPNLEDLYLYLFE